MEIMEYTIDRYDEVLALLQSSPGISIRSADSREATGRYLTRNAGLNFLAIENGKVIGCAMCGHDGRRGYLQHVVVEPASRRKGIANSLVERCLGGLESLGIPKIHIDVLTTNVPANRYWERRGWKKRDDLNRYSLVRSGDSNA